MATKVQVIEFLSGMHGQTTFHVWWHQHCHILTQNSICLYGDIFMPEIL